MQSLMKDKKAGVESYGLLGEPAVTTAVSKGLIENFDLQKEYQNATNSAVSGYAQAVLVARKDIAENKALIEAVLAAFEKNDTKLAEDSKAVVDGIKSKFTNSTLDSSKMTKEVIARCGIKTLRASSNPGIIETTLMKFEAINKKAIGDKLPDGDFYYAA